MIGERTIIVGAGLGGACAAACLRRERTVMVLEAGLPGEGASGASAGLVNPFPGLRATPAWRFDEALEALHEVMVTAEMRPSREHGLLRPARDEEQCRHFANRANEHPGELEWLAEGLVAERWPAVHAPLGALWVKRGTAVDTPALIQQLLQDVDVRTGARVISVGEDASTTWVETSAGDRLEAETVILAPGDGFRHIPQLAGLPMGRLKGQTVRIRRPPDLAPLPLIAGDGYAVPEADSVLIGSTYEWSFTHTEPTDTGTREILRKVSRMIKGLEKAPVLEARAGVRVTVPARISRRRLPLVGPLPGLRRVWVILGLGSKGLLTAPLVAKRLVEWIADPTAIPRELCTIKLM